MWINKNKYLYLKHRDEDRITELEQEVVNLKAEMKSKENTSNLPDRHNNIALFESSRQALDGLQQSQARQMQGGLGGLLGHSVSNPCGFAFAK